MNNTTNVLLALILAAVALVGTYMLGREQGMVAASTSFSTSISAASLASLPIVAALNAIPAGPVTQSPGTPPAAGALPAAPKK